MPKMHPSIRQWVFSFLAVDLIFWMLFAWGCVTDANSCWESFSFAPIVLYPLTTFPLIAVSSVQSLLGRLDVIPTTIVFVAFGILTHVLLGTLVGWALRKTKISPFVSFAVALVVLIGTTCAVTYYNFQAEMARESKPPVPTHEDIVWSTWPEYGDPQGRFDFRVAPGMTETSAQEPYSQLATVEASYASDSASYHPINYSQNSWFLVSSEKTGEDQCYVVKNGGQDTAFDDERTIGATTWKVATSNDAGAGNRYEQTLYRTYLDGTCWEMAATLHYASDFTDIDEAAMSASQGAARAELADMASTFRFSL